jgi:hypothetical protein
VRTTARSVLAALALAGLAAAPPASAGDGSAEYPEHGGVGYGESTKPPERDSAKPREREPEKPPPKPEPKPEPRPADPGGPKEGTGGGGRPELASFSVDGSRLYLFGRAARVRFRIDDASELVSVGLYLTRQGGSAPVRAIDLGMRATGTEHVYRLTGREGAPLPEGPYRVRVVARDASGKTLVARARTGAVDEISFHRHHFPLRGDFPYGDPGSRFGAMRNGHVHQGQDVAAPEGTPVLAPRGGRIAKVDFQEGGAGNYIVLDGAGERDSYVFMHLEAGSVRVRDGQRVRTGAWIGNVGNTGGSSGAHLHFEIWQGPWYAGGKPVDPYPSLRRWDRWS